MAGDASPTAAPGVPLFQRSNRLLDRKFPAILTGQVERKIGTLSGSDFHPGLCGVNFEFVADIVDRHDKVFPADLFSRLVAIEPGEVRVFRRQFDFGVGRHYRHYQRQLPDLVNLGLVELDQIFGGPESFGRQAGLFFQLANTDLRGGFVCFFGAGDKPPASRVGFDIGALHQQKFPAVVIFLDDRDIDSRRDYLYRRSCNL